ncbi:hypothetical protein VTL71DRAFT_13183 [Oculimacula yallundae]|uniref:Uncharacterized protein n=1 Tax=Oculimacula yallundae TaxID=86028 RepID=A0ABR4CKX3_9HELO
MYIKKAITLIAASATLLLGAPIEEMPRIIARDSVNMRLCINPNWDSCTTFNFVALGVCQSLPSNLNDRISSLDHSQPHSCRFWQHTGCAGDWIGGNQDEYQNLKNQGFDNKISSWRCS